MVVVRHADRKSPRTRVMERSEIILMDMRMNSASVVIVNGELERYVARRPRRMAPAEREVLRGARDRFGTRGIPKDPGCSTMWTQSAASRRPTGGGLQMPHAAIRCTVRGTCTIDGKRETQGVGSESTPAAPGVASTGRTVQAHQAGKPAGASPPSGAVVSRHDPRSVPDRAVAHAEGAARRRRDAAAGVQRRSAAVVRPSGAHARPTRIPGQAARSSTSRSMQRCRRDDGRSGNA